MFTLFLALFEPIRTVLVFTKACLDFFIATIDDSLRKGHRSDHATHRSYSLALSDWQKISVREKTYLFYVLLNGLRGKHLDIEDRKLPFEGLMQFLGDLPNDKIGNFIVNKTTTAFIGKFWNDLERPPRNYFANWYRSPDGSKNSVLYPEMGKAGTPYAMTLQRRHISRKLPSAAALFDRLLSRDNLESGFDPHPSGLNSLFFYLATLITHDIFQTDPQDPLRNLTTSYADLSPLYGNSKELQDSVRTKENGNLKPDTWADASRLIFQPSGVAGLLIIFSRNHNRITKMLLQDNENGRFTDLLPEESDEMAFQMARNINCACYANLILHDYVRSILGMKPGQDPVLNPLRTPPAPDPKNGNCVSLEFNFVYRWHSAISQADSEWSDRLFNPKSPFADYEGFKKRLKGAVSQAKPATDKVTGDVKPPQSKPVSEKSTLYAKASEEQDSNIYPTGRSSTEKEPVAVEGAAAQNEVSRKERGPKRSEKETEKTAAPSPTKQPSTSPGTREGENAVRSQPDNRAAAGKKEMTNRLTSMVAKVLGVPVSEKELASDLPILLGHHRDPDTGRFADSDVVDMIKTSMGNVAGRFGVYNVPASLRSVEIVGIEQGRKAGVATLNEFREYFHLQRHKTFEDLNPNPRVVRTLSQLYTHVDDVELYPGLMVEETKRCGVALPYTISRAILADAVNLLRNDRFYTDELTEFKLTKAGFALQSGQSGVYASAFPNILSEMFPRAFTESELVDIFVVPGFEPSGASKECCY